MLQNIGQLKIAMHDFIFDEGGKRMENLDEVLNSLILGYFLLQLQIGS